MKTIVWVAALLLACGLAPAAADYKDEVGYTRLAAELGQRMPSGAGVGAMQVEAASGGNWMPDANQKEFAGKTIINRTGGAGGTSGHATSAGRHFYGRLSMAPGISAVEVYEASDWLVQQPLITANRIANHSWVGDNDAKVVSAILRRVDWLVESYEILQFAGLQNSPASRASILGSAYNVITVGRSDGSHTRGSTSVADAYPDGVYESVRTRPDLVAPLGKTSFTTPLGSAAAAVLIDFAHRRPELSSSSTLVRIGEAWQTVYNAERTEVIRAALMAGADRLTACRCDHFIGGYRSDADHRSANGLDRRYGSGQLNVRNSYHILAAGEQESDRPVTPTGFDHHPAFGGAGGAPDSVAYALEPAGHPRWLYAVLAWNLDVQMGWHAVLYDMDLILYDVTGERSEAAASRSRWENTETVAWPLQPGRRYELQVVRGATQLPFRWDYALAWRTAGPGPGDADADGLPDKWETTHGLDPADPTDADFHPAGADPDEDRLTNYQEYCRGTDPRQSDTDADGIDDGAELALWAESCSDPDGDGLVNILDPDADNDGFLDGLEINSESDPSDPASHPPPARPGLSR